MPKFTSYIEIKICQEFCSGPGIQLKKIMNIIFNNCNVKSHFRQGFFKETCNSDTITIVICSCIRAGFSGYVRLAEHNLQPSFG